MDKDSISQSLILYLELLFLISLVLPPLVESIGVLYNFNSQIAAEYGKIMSGATNPAIFATLIQGLFALGMFYRARIDKIKSSKRVSSYVFILGFLVVNSFFWNWISQISSERVLNLPDIQVQNFFLFLLATAIAAFYEEMVYRWYGPKVFSLVLKNTGEGSKYQQKRIKSICIEVFFVVVFALSHGYAGWVAVGNALLAGLGLRLCTLKTGSPLPSFFAHLSYNFIQFYLLLK